MTDQAKQITREALFTMLNPVHHKLVQRWLDRGDGCAVYVNAELGHPGQGDRQFLSFGSDAAQIESDTPPQTDARPWGRYQLALPTRRRDTLIGCSWSPS